MERKAALRSATLSEFDAVHKESQNSVRAALERENDAANRRNAEFSESVSMARAKSIQHIQSLHSKDPSGTASALQRAKERYLQSVEKNLESWLATLAQTQRAETERIKEERSYFFSFSRDIPNPNVVL